MDREYDGFLDSESFPGEAAVTGWRDFEGTWYDIDKGDSLPDDPMEMEAFTFHYVSDMGDDVYYTVEGLGWEDWGDVWESIADTLDKYGVTAS
jgi:hypothetical protein